MQETIQRLSKRHVSGAELFIIVSYINAIVILCTLQTGSFSVRTKGQMFTGRLDGYK